MSKSSNGASGLGHVDQIREIIVGDHLRHADTRMAELESRLSDRLASVEKRLERAYEARERSLTKQIERLNKRLATEKADRVAATKKTAAELATTIKALESRLDDRASNLNRAKVDRADLADLLEGLTARLRGNVRS